MSTRVRRLTAGSLIAAAALVGAPAVAAAEPAPATSQDLDHAIDKLAADPDHDKDSLAAAEKIDKVPATPPATGPGRTYQDAIAELQQHPFLYPTISPFCQDGTLLGGAPAVAEAVPGPWPNLNVLGQDVNAVDKGQILYAFVPSGFQKESGDESGLQLAWFNLRTLKGGIEQMGSLADAVSSSIPASVPVELRSSMQEVVRNIFTSAVPIGGLRAVPVRTGKGTVVAAMFGSVRNGDRTCYFLPTVAITDNN